ncbi:33bea315-da1a-4562-b187-579884043be1 [Sclerotinia trifoliorum]|uniref:33bea315-da1a-4562-b187-579884043be1 n=1 Tax=Sclerotinia trifoliorum TaxID=28548 RepID=A0A8H2VR14_9HELO|nr:33bea315-da1a-4562-b187-579884043be1 [Sclerotinia trifoliorum]
MNSRGRESSRPPTIVTAATEKEARRVLEWQEEVARSTAGSSTAPTSDEAYRAVAPSHVSRAPPARIQISHAPQTQTLESPPFRRAETFPRGMRREVYGEHRHPGTQVSVRRDRNRDDEQTVYVDEVERHDQEKEKEKNNGIFGMSNKALVGTFLGAAAGAAFAYAMVKSEDPEYELDSEHKNMPGLRRSYTTGHAETIASSSRGGERRYRVIEAPMPPPASSYTRIQRDRERERESVLSPIEERSYYSSISHTNTGTKIRTRTSVEQGEGSNAGTARPPTAINVRDKPQSIAPSRVSEKTSTVKAASRAPTMISRVPQAKTQVSIRESEYEYGSSPAQVSSATNRRSGGTEETKKISHTHTTIKFSPSKVSSRPLHSNERERIPRSEATWERDDISVSAISERPRAREVPLPASTVISARYGGGYREQGGGYTHVGDVERDRKSCIDRGVDEDGKSYFNPRGAMSVAPSDSVSSVGTKKERLERLRGRLERDLRV